MAGLLTRGSQRARSFPDLRPVVIIGFARRLQLRGQSRNWQPLTVTAPYSLFISDRHRPFREPWNPNAV